MILKGIISSIDFDNQKAEVILPEYEYAVTKPLPVYGGFKANELSIKDFVLVQAFNDNIGDGIILKKSTLQDIPEATTDYNELSNKPKINDVELVGNKSLDELGIQPKIAEVDEEEGVAEAVLPIVAPKIVADEAEAEVLKGNLDWSYITNKPSIPDEYTLPIAGETTLGGIKTAYIENGQNYAIKTDSEGNAYVNLDDIASLINEKILQAFPVGTIIESENSANPSTYLGGTWEAYAEGKVTVGIDAYDSDFNTVGKTGGSKELQEHNHTASGSTGSAGSHNHSGTANSAGSHSHSASSGSAGSHSHITPVMRTSVEANGYGLSQTGAFQNRPIVAGDSSAGRGTTSTSSGSHSHTITVNSAGAHTHSLTINSNGAHTHTVSITVNNAGSGDSGNLQPYITVYKWIRTA